MVPIELRTARRKYGLQLVSPMMKSINPKGDAIANESSDIFRAG